MTRYGIIAFGLAIAAGILIWIGYGILKMMGVVG